ncbi:hypothetical protein K470DRAFT_240088 [Piedraia hortae CBS 480.64]|uniref:Uncharacterized protein n=1 Tax=Piedraia hortae CBS 480.64 TaxID=1314780 RepID=A0A6A7C9J3_9PEZI|nr:hypothetical protein K470DRAFT_240088 [Piedraia hortae CBS 480.64]
MPMPSKDTRVATTADERGLTQYLWKWGGSSVPPSVLATFITAQHLRPFQTLPMLFPPVLLLSSYLNLQGFQKDAAGVTAAWSAAYMALASRRKLAIRQRFNVRGIVRGATMGMCAMNVVACGWVYAFGKRKNEA